MARLELIVDPKKAKQGFREAERGGDRYRRSARQATEQTNKVQGSFQRLVGEAGSLKGALAGVGFGFIATQSARLATQSLETTAAISEQADVAGIGAERFQELTKAFSDLGGVQESVTSGALRRFNRRFGLAQEGMGAANDTLERLNINLDQGTGPALEEAIRKLAGMENSANRTAEASQLFGEDAGPRLAAVLAQGTEAIEGQIEKLNEQGRVLGEDLTKDARRANDTLGEIKDTLDADFNRRIAENADLIESLAEAYSFAADNALSFAGRLVAGAEKIGELAASATTGGFGAGAIIDDLDEVNTQIELLTNRSFALQNQIQSLESRDNLGAREQQRLENLRQQLEDNRETIAELRDEREKLNREADLFIPKVDQQADSVDGLNRSLDEFRTLQQQISQLPGSGDEPADPFAIGRGRAFQDQITSLDQFAERFARIEQEAMDAANAADQFLASLDPFERGTVRGFQRNITTLDEWSEQWEGITPRVERANREIYTTSDSMRRLRAETVDFGNIAQSAFEDAIIEGERFGTVLEALGEDIQRLLLRQTVTNPLAQGVGGFANNLFSNTFGAASNIETLDQTVSGLPGRAGGGPVTAGNSFIVGERGPEVFTPKQSGNITPNNQLGGGQGDVIVNVQNAPGPPKVQQRQDSSGRRVVDLIFPAIDEYIESGRGNGPMGRQFGVNPTVGRS